MFIIRVALREKNQKAPETLKITEKPLMRDFLGTIAKVIIVIALGIILVNDIGAMVVTRWQAKERVAEVIEATVATFRKTQSREATAKTAHQVASEKSLVIKEGPTYKNNTIYLTIIIPPKRTVIIHRIKELENFYTKIEVSAKI